MKKLHPFWIALISMIFGALMMYGYIYLNKVVYQAGFNTCQIQYQAYTQANTVKPEVE